MAERGPGSPPSMRRQMFSLAVGKFKKFKGRSEKRVLMLEKRHKRMCKL